MDAALKSTQDSLRHDQQILPKRAPAKVVAPQIARILALNVMQQAIGSGKDQELKKIKSAEDFVKMVNIYSKQSAEHQSFKELIEVATLDDVTNAALKRPDGKGLIQAMKEAHTKAEQMRHAPVRNAQLQQDEPQRGAGMKK